MRRDVTYHHFYREIVEDSPVLEKIGIAISLLFIEIQCYRDEKQT